MRQLERGAQLTYSPSIAQCQALLQINGIFIQTCLCGMLENLILIQLRIRIVNKNTPTYHKWDSGAG